MLEGRCDRRAEDSYVTGLRVATLSLQYEVEGGTMNITSNEKKVLVAILASEYQDGREAEYAVGHHVWSMYIAEAAGIAKRSYSGVVASLVKKGLVTVAVVENDTIALTATGWTIADEATKQERAAFQRERLAAVAAKGVTP
jgi:DNA-binding MarR family transcriptional regulator